MRASSSERPSGPRPAPMWGRFGAALLAGLLLGAWTPATQQAIALKAASIVPRDLWRQIDRHKDELKRGAVEPFSNAAASRHVKNPDGSGALDAAIHDSITRTVEMIVQHRPFAEIVHQLGVVSHYVADANDPLLVSDSDPREATYRTDYERYVDSARPRFAVVFYGPAPRPDERTDIDTLLSRALARGRLLYPFIGTEYLRVGSAGSRAFDDRSTAFGIAAVAHSRAVSDVALVFRTIWIEAGGIDPRQPQTHDASHLLLLPSERESR